MFLPFKTRAVLRAILALTLSSTFLHAAPYGQEGMPIEWTQPDGTKLSLRVFGDEFYARTETEDGHTVVYNAAKKAYEYARVSQDGKKLIPGGIRANGKAPAGLAKRLTLPGESRRAIWENRYKKLAPNERAEWAKRVKAARQRKGLEPKDAGPQNDGGGAPQSSPPAFAPVTGAYVGLTILVQFPDDPATGTADPTNFPATKAAMENYCNQIGYTGGGNTGSVRDYFLAQSLNQTDYTQVVTEIVTLPQPRAYYNWSDYPTNATLRDGGLTGRLVLNDAITILKAQGFDFTGVTRDGSNRVVATNVLFAGATSGVWPDGLWPHRWVLSPQVNVGTTQNPIYIYDYQITNAQTSSVPIGTFCHENGHLLLKYPDLYDYGGESRGVGNHCLMGGGNHLNGGKTPCPINGYFKDVSGWSNVVDITTSDFFTDSLPTTNNEGYRYRKPGTNTEYFLIENRGTGDPWAQYVPDKGILIWHVDELVSGNENQQMTASQHYELSLIQADGAYDLEFNRDSGDSTDAFDSTYPNFNDTSAADSKWWSGANSGVKVAVLSSAGASMNVQFGLPANSIQVSYPNGGESIYLGSSQTISWAANITGNVKIDLYKGGVLQSVLSANEANDGSYSWTVSSGLPSGNDYTIRVTSVDNPAYLDSSNANFTIIPQPTLADALETPGYIWTNGGNASWYAQSTTTQDGIDAAQSGVIADSQSSSMETTVTGPGTMTFWWRVSSESGYDFLRFYINNVEQTGSLARISGEVGWVQKTVTIPAGAQTVKWNYTKDGSVVAGSDAAWVDQVVYTPSNLPGSLAVTPAGGLTASGSFGGAFSPSSLQFTLSNPGNTSINWTAAKTQAWVTLSSTGGTLAVGANTTVTASINSGANTLNVGGYSDTVTFTNSTNGTGNTTRAVSLTVNPFAAGVTLTGLNPTYDGSPKAVSVTTTPAGLDHTVTYDSSSTPPTNAGTYAVVATVTEPNYTGSASGSLVIAKAPQTINFAALDPVLNTAAPFDLTANATSGLSVTYGSSNSSVATVSGSTVTIVGIGTTTITASQAGNANYAAAASVPQTLNVVRSNPLAVVTGAPYRILIGQSLSLNGGASEPSYGETITTYEWDLNNDSTFGDATGATPAAITYAELTGTWGMVQGVNTIQLRVTDSASKTSTVSASVELIASLTWDANGTTAGQTNGAGAWLGANLWWDGAANRSWSAGSNAVFGGPNTAGGAVTLASPTSVNAITFNTFTGTYTLGTAGQALTINGGINKTSASSSAAVSVVSPINLGADQTWSNNSTGTLTTSNGTNLITNNGYQLTVDGTGNTSFGAINSTTVTLAGSGALVKNGTGLLSVGGANSGFSGNVIVNGGTLRMTNNIGGLGTGNITLNGGVLDMYWGLTFNRTLGDQPGQIQLVGGVSGFSQNGGGQTTTVTFNNDSNFEAVWGSSFFNPSTLVLTADTAQGAAVTTLTNKLNLNGETRTIHVSAGVANQARASISGQIRNSTGTAGLVKTGAGLITLSHASNAWNGTTTVSGGVLDLAGMTNANLGGGSGRNVSVASGTAIRFNALSNTFLSRIVETADEFTVMTGTTANNLDFSGGAGANLPNAFLGNWASNGAKTEYSGTITPAADAYRLGSSRSNGLLGLTNTSAMSGNRGLIIGGGSVELVGPKTFTGDTVIRTGARLGLAAISGGNGVALALQNSTLDVGSAGGNFWFESGGASGPITGSVATTSAVFGGLKGSRNLASVYTTGTGANNSAATAVANITGFTLNLAAGKVIDYSGAIANFATGTTLTKTGDGTQILSGTNTYTGATSILGGTLTVTGSTIATSAINFANNAALGLVIGSPVTAASAAVDFTGGKIAVSGTPLTSSHLLLSAASMTGTPVLVDPIPGYELVVAGNQLFLNAAAPPDTTAPTLAGIANDTTGSVVATTPVNYTVTFSEDMDASTVSAADFGNAGTASGVIGAVSEISPGVFNVPVLPNSAGTLQLKVNAGAILTDVAGNPLDTTSEIADGTVITVTPLNTAPVANPQNLATAEDTALPVTLTGSDAELDALTYTVVAPPTNGTLSGTAPNLIYTPTNNFNGSDGFTFIVNDGALDSAVAAVSITVTPVNDAPVAIAQSVGTNEDVSLPITLSGSDVENDDLTYTIVNPPSNGTLSGTAPNVIYTPATNSNGADIFTFTVNDGTSDSAMAVISINIAPANDAPVAVAQNVATNEDTALPITLAGTDVDLDNLTYTIVTQPTNGTLSGTAPNVTYTPAANSNASDSFTFLVNDGTVDSAVATVSISITPVNDAPVATAQNVTTDEDTALPITLAGTDAELESLNYTVVTQPANGTLSGTAPNLVYTPAANSNGADSFTFLVNDGTADSAAANVSISITPINDAPVFTANPIIGGDATEDSAYIASVAGSASDVDAGTTLTYAKVSGPAWLNVAADGTLAGTPDNNSVGANVFTVSVSDGTAPAVEATLNITVININDAPVFASNPINGNDAAEDAAYSGTLAGSVTDVDAGATLAYAKVSGPSWLIVAADGTLSGTPDNGNVGMSSFTVSVSDGIAAAVEATLYINVINTNDAPAWAANPITGTDATEDSAYSGNIADSAGDVDAGATLTYAKISGPPWLNVAANGTLNGTPNNGDVGINSFTVSVSDGIAAPAQATLNITVTNTNDAPTWASNPITGMNATEDAAYSGNIAASASDADAGATLTFAKVSGPAWLSVASNGALSGTPTNSDVGANGFTVSVSDGITTAVQATLNISVTNTNDAPVFTQDPIIAVGANEGIAYTGVTLSGTAADSDPGDTITYSKVSGPEWLTVASNGTLSGTPPSGSAGLNSFTVRATDSTSANDDAILQITVTGLPLPWIASDIGTGMLAGSTTHSSGTFTQAGSGVIGSTSDRFRYTYQTLSGDGEIIARISSLQNTGTSSRIGVMIRDSLAANSKQIFMGMTGSNAYRWVRRTSTSGSTSTTNSSTGTVPNTWVRLVRSGSTITAYRSTNGTSWTTVGSTTNTTFASTCYIGIAVGSGSNTTLNTSQFTNVSVTP